jgi:hypothetical protein
MGKVRKPVLNPTAKDMADFNLSRLFYAVKDALPEILRLWDKYREPAPDPRKHPDYWQQQAEHIAVELFIHSDVNEILSRLVATAGRNNAKVMRKLNKVIEDEKDDY